MTKSAPPNPPPETSSLFSLSSLQEMAGPTPAAPSKPPPAAEEGSGMLDILAIADSSRQTGSVQSRHTPLPTLLASPVARVGMQEDGLSSRAKLAMAVMALAIVVLGGATAFLALRPAATASVGTASGEAAVLPPPGFAGAPANAPRPPATAPVPVEAPAAAVQAPQPSDGAGAGLPATARNERAATRPEKRRDTEPRTELAAPEPAPAAKGDDSIDNLLDQALGGSPRKARTEPRTPSAAAGSATPSREDVLAAMVAVTPRVKACAKDQGGMAMAKLTVSGATGRVLNVTVDGVTDATVKSCVVHEASRAKLPPFSNPSFSVTYPFKL